MNSTSVPRDLIAISTAIRTGRISRNEGEVIVLVTCLEVIDGVMWKPYVPGSQLLHVLLSKLVVERFEMLK